MNKWSYLAGTLWLLILLNGCTAGRDKPAGIIPKPNLMTQHFGGLQLSEEQTIWISDPSLQFEADYLISHLEKQTGLRLRLSDDNPVIRLNLTSDDGGENEEVYYMKTDKKGIEIKSVSRTGIFYGIQSLRQLAGTDGWVPAVEIQDQPRFAWRGLMLDVSRHFFPKEYILEVLDYLALHKLNTFHWHLTDDQGWRIEIKKFPRLTEISAWRVDREHEHWNSWTPAEPGEKATYGGFYTQDEIREIVQYARDRHITIVPEIEMPGHTTAVLAAYPELSCTGGPFQVPSGGLWPITDIFCAGKEETFSFLEDVLTEVMELFPSAYIHIGGDEANKKEWETCPLCQARIREEGLADEHELQSYFITRIESFLNQNGRQLIGWDEILEGGLAPNAAVMSWRGMGGGVEAARSGHPVVMSPTSHCYFDYYQGKPELEPLAIGGYLPLEKVYSFDPVPDELSAEEAEYILGAQANLWTEYVYTPDDADYMLFPRLSALAEVVWSDTRHKDFDDFAKRLQAHLRILDRYDIQYSRSFAHVDVSSTFLKTDQSFAVELSNALNFGEIRYTLDGSVPDQQAPVYKDPLSVRETATIQAATFVDGEIYSKVSSEKVWIHLATGAPVEYHHPWAEQYPAGGADGLTNSLRGSVNHTDGRWQGYNGTDLDVVIDLQQATTVTRVTVGCLQHIGSWIFFPEAIEVELLDEDKNPVTAGRAENDQSPRDPLRMTHDYSLSFQDQARFIRVKAHNLGLCPDWHGGAGSPAWLFVDEIIVE